MFWLRVYLLAGLLAHKALWELLKQPSASQQTKLPLSLLIVKGIKVAILLGILLQAGLPLVVKAGPLTDILPISTDRYWLGLIGVALYTIGLLVAILGRLQLGGSWSDIETPRTAEERAVVSNGVYAYVRHPIYSGDLMLLLGLELALNSWLVLGAVALIPIVFYRAVQEEKLLAESLTGYDSYAKKTKRFIPFLV